jgi:hypothetical protein
MQMWSQIPSPSDFTPKGEKSPVQLHLRLYSFTAILDIVKTRKTPSTSAGDQTLAIRLARWTA